MDEQLNSINSIEPRKHSSKTKKIVENTKKAVGKVLTKAGIGLNTMLPMASTTTSTVVPASVNTITAIAPTASTVAKAISLGTAASLLTACGGKDDPDGPIEIKDMTPPTINVSKSEVDITGGKEIRINGNQLYIGDDLIASRNDDKTRNCAVLLSINGKTITSGTTLSEEGTLTIKVSDEAGNVKSTDIKLNIIKNAPSITVNQYEVNIFGGVTVNIDNNQLLFGDEVIASRNDDNLESCKVSLGFNGQNIKPGDTINESGTLSITITNKNSLTSTAEITLTNDAIFGLENLRNASLQVDQQINLLNGITFANGVELVKMEIEIDGKRNTITDPYHYTPDYPGTCNIILTLKGKNGNTAEVRVDNLTIKPLEYKAMEITNINPEDLMPKVDVGDKNVYKHIEHLRVPESTVIRDMMWKYGAGNYSPEEYQQLMNRLNTGMVLENPKGYDNYETIGGDPASEPSNHAHIEYSILNTLIDHAKFIVVNPKYGNRYPYVQEVVNQNPNNMYIFGISAYASVNKETYLGRDNNSFKNLGKSKNFLIFIAGSNIDTKNGILRNKIYHEDVDGDEHGVYGAPSPANGKNDNNADRHMIVTIGTNSTGNIDQTDEIYESSKYPVGFHNNVLFAGRAFPYHSANSGKIEAEKGKYATSFTNYSNVCFADLCFQMKADIPNTSQLLEMIRSTALTDHIKFNGEDQPLILINPAGFFKKYLMPTSLPSSLKSDKTTSLEKGYYKGVIFDIPGAEVKINGQWVAYNNTNKSQIKSQNPMTLEWRINGDLCRKLGYKGKSLQGKIIAVDDKRNGLNIEKDFSVNIQ